MRHRTPDSARRRPSCWSWRRRGSRRRTCPTCRLWPTTAPPHRAPPACRGWRCRRPASPCCRGSCPRRPSAARSREFPRPARPAVRLRAAAAPPREKGPHENSFDRDFRGGVLREAVVAGPPEREAAALGCHGMEGDEWIGGDGLVERGLEDLLAVVGADERGDDVARDWSADVVVAETGLHDVRDQRLDLDDLAALCLWRNVDEGARGHQGKSSRQAPSVMM